MRQPPEILLHWLWRRRLYQPEALRTVEGEKVEIIDPGKFCENGPDFQGARLRIGDLFWIGSVEIDVKPEQWYAHRHHELSSYRSVILHVVWRAEGTVHTVDIDGREIPVLPLAPAVFEDHLRASLAKEQAFPCAALAKQLSEEPWLHLYDEWGERRLRLRHQSYRSEKEFFHALWVALLYSFGVPHGEPFRRLAEALSWTDLRRHAETLLDKEAALFGVSGLLEGVSAPTEPYEESLLRRWDYLRRKLRWQPLRLQWAPTRPAASPWIRLAQVAALTEAYPQPAQMLHRVPADLPLPSPYWQRHWGWQRPLALPLRRTSRHLYQNVLINALYPFAIYYLRSIGQVEAALEIVQRFRNLPPEKHRYSRLYARYAYPAKNAWQTQGQIQLWRSACQPQACLTCPIAHQLLAK